MNEPAVRLEEQIISMTSGLETRLYQGWILKRDSCRLTVYPLYGRASGREELVSRIRKCEEISRQASLSCEFRIAEHTNYHLASLLEANGYRRHCHIIAERLLSEQSAMPGHGETSIVGDSPGPGMQRQELLYLPDQAPSCQAKLDDMLRLAAENQISRILVSIPENEDLLAYYREQGFRKVYLCRCYQKEDL